MSPGVRESLAFHITDVDGADVTACLARNHDEGEEPKARSSRQSAAWLVILMLGCAAVYASSTRGGWLGQHGEFVYGLVVGVAVGAGGMIGLLWLLARANQQTLRKQCAHPKDRWFNGPWRVRIGPEGLKRTSAESTQTYGWSVVNRIVATDDFAFFFTGQNEGHVVPRSAFASEADLRSFVSEARRLRDEAGRDLPPVLEISEPSESVRPATDVAGIRARPHERGE